MLSVGDCQLLLLAGIRISSGFVCISSWIFLDIH